MKVKDKRVMQSFFNQLLRRHWYNTILMDDKDKLQPILKKIIYMDIEVNNDEEMETKYNEYFMAFYKVNKWRYKKDKCLAIFNYLWIKYWPKFVCKSDLGEKA